MSEYTPIPVCETSPGSFTVQFPKDTMTGKFERNEETMSDLIEEARGSFKATNASANLIWRLANALEAAEAKLARVEALHEAYEDEGCTLCQECTGFGYLINHPCPTIAALTDEGSET